MINEIIIDKKKFVILPYETFKKMTQKEVHKVFKHDLIGIKEARSRTKARIDKWAKLK